MTVFSRPSFQNDSLWQQAITHRSFTNEQPAAQHNERLEFLGDAILNFLSGDYLYQRFPNRPEGTLSQTREFLVDESQLCHFAMQIGLGEDLRLGNGMEQSGGRGNSRLLCSAFEAVVGAYFLDCDRNIQTVRDYIWPMFDSAIGQITEAEIEIKDEKSRLQEWAQKHFGKTPEYVTVSSRGPDHDREFTVEVRILGQPYGQGRGKRKRSAQKAAARAVLKAIKSGSF